MGENVGDPGLGGIGKSGAGGVGVEARGEEATVDLLVRGGLGRGRRRDVFGVLGVGGDEFRLVKAGKGVDWAGRRGEVEVGLVGGGVRNHGWSCRT